jgi:hypothetical protein
MNPGYRLGRRGKNRPCGSKPSALIHLNDVAFGIRSTGRPIIGEQIFYEDVQWALDTIFIEKESMIKK